MDVQLKEIIEKIKLEGVKNAEEKSAQIIHDTKQKANEIIAGAHKEASEIISRARKESDRFEQSGKEALKQAGRDLILTLKTKVMDLFNEVIQTEVKSSLTEHVLEETIISLIKSWNKKSVGEVRILLSPADLKKIENKLRLKLAEEIKRGVEIKPFPQIEAGFRVSIKDGSAYYNFSDQGIAEILAEYLNRRLAENIKEAIQKEN